MCSRHRPTTDSQQFYKINRNLLIDQVKIQSQILGKSSELICDSTAGKFENKRLKPGGDTC